MKTYNRVCRGCNQEVTLELHNQRYCAPCREAKDAADLAARTVACVDCGEVKYCSYGICEDCHEAKERARRAEAERREVRRIRRFGPCPNHPSNPATHDGVCFVCHREVLKERRKQAFWAAQRAQEAAEDQAAEAEERELAARFARLPDDAKLLALLRLGYVPAWLTRAPDVAEPEPANPEQVPAADQDAIDDAFRGLMADVDL